MRGNLAYRIAARSARRPFTKHHYTEPSWSESSESSEESEESEESKESEESEESTAPEYSEPSENATIARTGGGSKAARLPRYSSRKYREQHMIQPKEFTGEDELESFDNAASRDENEVAKHVQHMQRVIESEEFTEEDEPDSFDFAQLSRSVHSKAPTPSTKQAPSQALSIFGVPLGVTATAPSESKQPEPKEASYSNPLKSNNKERSNNKCDNKAKQDQTVHTVLKNKPKKQHSDEEDETEYCTRCRGPVRRSESISIDLMIACQTLRLWLEDPEVFASSFKGGAGEWSYVKCLRTYLNVIDAAGRKKNVVTFGHRVWGT